MVRKLIHRLTLCALSIRLQIGISWEAIQWPQKVVFSNPFEAGGYGLRAALRPFR
jgi:hypothetical protein